MIPQRRLTWRAVNLEDIQSVFLSVVTVARVTAASSITTEQSRVTHAVTSPPPHAGKLARPDAQSPLVDDATSQRLAPLRERRLTVVRAPAGYGKTALVADACRRLHANDIWYTVDALDRDAFSFMAGLVRALRSRTPHLGELLHHRLEDEGDTSLHVHEALKWLLSALRVDLQEDTLLVLDDLHEVAGLGAISVVDSLVANGPEHLHVAILARFDPGVSTAKLRLRNQLLELGADDLRLRSAQVAGLIERSTGTRPAAALVDRLITKTQGWPAGVVLACRAAAAQSLDLHTLSVTDPAFRAELFSYLAEQVYAREDATVRHFLERSCCLDRITVDTASRVTGQHDAARILADLVERNVFTTRGPGDCFHYHPLLREYLRHKVVEEEGPAAYRHAQLRAARVCERAGDLRAAVDIYLAADEPLHGVAAIGRGGLSLIDHVSVETLDDWIVRLPPDSPPAQAWRHLLRSQTLCRRGAYDEALASLDEAEARPRAVGAADLAFLLAAARERTLYWKGDYTGAAEVCEQAILAATSDTQRVHALLGLGAARIATNDWEHAERAWSEAERIADEHDANELLRLECQRLSALATQGLFRDAAARSLAARLHVERRMPSEFIVGFLNLLAVARLYLADYQAADESLTAACALADQCACDCVKPLLRDAQGQILMARGDLASGTERCLDAAADPAIAHDHSCRALALSHVATGLRRAGEHDQAHICYERAWALVKGSRLHHARLTCASNIEYTHCLADARRSVDELRAMRLEAQSRRLPFLTTKCGVFHAIVRDSRGSREEALWLLRGVVPTALEMGHVHFLAQELIHVPELTLDLLETAHDAIVLEGLVSALATHPRATGLFVAALGRGERVARAVLDGSCDLSAEARRAVVQRAVRHRSPIVRKLGNALRDQEPTVTETSAGLPELTPRELEVLALIAGGCRNPDIAARLVLSPATVKTYVNRIFSKLGVSDRVQAALAYHRCTPSDDRLLADSDHGVSG